MRFSAASGTTISQAVSQKICSDLCRSLATLNVDGIVRSLASIADPDDFGGVNVVAAVTCPGNRICYYVGQPTSTLPAVSTLSGSRSFSLRYPVGNLTSIPSKARFKGAHFVNGTVSITP
jgi:hypothetical protein